jgi:hypothetical protein
MPDVVGAWWNEARHWRLWHGWTPYGHATFEGPYSHPSLNPFEHLWPVSAELESTRGNTMREHAHRDGNEGDYTGAGVTSSGQAHVSLLRYKSEASVFPGTSNL